MNLSKAAARLRRIHDKRKKTLVVKKRLSNRYKLLLCQTHHHVEVVALRGKSQGVSQLSPVGLREEPALIVAVELWQTTGVILVKRIAATRIKTVVDRPVQRMQSPCQLAAKVVALVGLHVVS